MGELDTQRLRVLADVSRAFADVAIDYQELIDTIARTTADLVGDGCQVTLVAGDGTSLVNAASAHRDPALEADYREFLSGFALTTATSTSVAATVARTGTPALVTDISPEAVVDRVDDALKPLVARLTVHSFVAVPIRARQTVIGTLSLMRSGPGRGYGPQDLTMLQDLADRAGLAIENARLYRDLQRLVQQRTTELAALAASERRLATILDSIGDAVITTDTEGRVEHMNPVAEMLTGWSRQEARGQPLQDAFHVHDARTGETVESPVERVLREQVGVALTNHSELVSRDGTVRPIADCGSPIRDEGGTLRGVVLVFRDTTRERDAEDARVRAIELDAASRRAEEANRLKSEFVANLSHELRTPLNSIIGFSQILYDQMVGALSPQQTECVGNIATSGRHLLELINDVLDLAKVEAGKLIFRPESVDPSSLLREVSATLQPAAITRGVHLAALVDPGLTELLIDPARVRQILYNLLSNAIKATHADGNVTLRFLEAGTDRFSIEVEDTGAGISPEDLPRLFVAFEQLDADAKEQRTGTGLGLALTRRLVEAQGGEMGVSSVVGRGSVFRATLPRRAGVTPFMR